MEKIDLARVPIECRSSYPEPFDQPCRGQTSRRLARSRGLILFGVNLTVIPARGWSSQRHWHSHEDEIRLHARCQQPTQHTHLYGAQTSASRQYKRGLDTHRPRLSDACIGSIESKTPSLPMTRCKIAALA